MPVPLITCRNKVTGAVAEVPETALPHIADWVPIDQPEPDVPTAQDAAGEPAARTTKSKAAPSAITEKE